jgi:hypothetical protein
MLKRLLHQVQHAQAVSEAVVIGSRISSVADAELMDAAQALNFGRGEKIKKPLISIPIDADIIVERVAKNLVGHGSSLWP